MSGSITRFFSFTMAASIVAGVFVAGCSSSDGDSQSTDSESADTDANDDQPAIANSTNEFDGAWLSDCEPFRLFMVPEEDQPGGFAQTTLTLDGNAGTFSRRSRVYIDAGCSIDNPDRVGSGSSGRIQFEATTTTISGLEATVVRYLSESGVPDLVGLLYREGDVLYQERRESTLIEDIVPTELALNVPFRLVN